MNYSHIQKYLLTPQLGENFLSLYAMEETTKQYKKNRLSSKISKLDMLKFKSKQEKKLAKLCATHN